MMLLTDSVSLRIFQFHKGAIRTFNTGLGEGIYPNFNSIKVRLEREMNNTIGWYIYISIP